MKHWVVLLAASVLFLGSCGPQEVGEMQRQSEAVDPENAQSAVVQLWMGAGELNVSGGADALMEANFAYNVSEWEPEVSYAVSGETGELSVE